MSDFEPDLSFPTRRQIVAALASADYPELEEILEDRPPLEASVTTNSSSMTSLSKAASKESAWVDVQQKAHDIYKIDGVRIIASDQDHVAAHVLGDHGTYESELQFVPGTKSPAMWNCSCPWASYSWGRSGRWKKYEGRMCSHALALMYEAQHDKSPIEKADWDSDPITHYEAPPPKEWRSAQLNDELFFVEAAEISSGDEKEAVHLFTTIKVNNQQASPNPEHDGFRYAYHQIMGDAQFYPNNSWGSAGFQRGEDLAHDFLHALKVHGVDTGKKLYRAIGLSEAKYNAMIYHLLDGSVDLPPASWTVAREATQEFGRMESEDTPYDHRILFVVRPGAKSWAIGQMSKRKDQREHIMGGRFDVLSIAPGDIDGQTTTVVLSQQDAWPDDFRAEPDVIEHMLFDSDTTQQSKTASETDAIALMNAHERGEHRDGPVDGCVHCEHDRLVNEAFPKLAEYTGGGTMIALPLPHDIGEQLAVEGGEDIEEMHVTLAYIPSGTQFDPTVLDSVVQTIAAGYAPPIEATISGYGTFKNGEDDVLFALPSSDRIWMLHLKVLDALDGAGIEYSKEHAWQPHITLMYGEGQVPDSLPEGMEFEFASMVIGSKDGWANYPFGDDGLPPLEAKIASVEADIRSALSWKSLNQEKHREGMALLEEITGARGNDWTHGGCLIAAQAIQKIMGGTVKAIVNDRGPEVMSRPDYWPMVQHYVVQNGSQYWDADGPHSEREITHMEEYGAFDKYPNLIIDVTSDVLQHNRGIFTSPSAVDKTVDFIRSTGKKEAGSATPSFSLSEQYIRSGKPTEDDVHNLIWHYYQMHGKMPSEKEESKLRAKMAGLPVAEGSDNDDYQRGYDEGYNGRAKDAKGNAAYAMGFTDGRSAYDRDAWDSTREQQYAPSEDAYREHQEMRSHGARDYMQEVRANLTDDLRKPKYQGSTNPMTGHCYVASEALYHLMGGKGAGMKAYTINHEGEPHWFLKDASGKVYDPTADQFKTAVPYDQAKGIGFLTGDKPSQRARILLDRINGTMTAALFPSTADDTPDDAFTENKPQELPKSQEDDEAKIGTLHEEPEAALPSTDGELDDDEEMDYGNGVGNFGASVQQDPYTPQPWAVNEQDQDRGEIFGDNIEKAQGIGDMSSSAGLADEGDEEDQNGGDEIFGDEITEAGGMGGGTAYQGSLDIEALRPAWLNPGVGEGGGSGVGDSDIAKAAQEHLARIGVKTFNRAEQEALINEGEDRMAANLGSLDLEGTHYKELEEALAGADGTGEAVLWW